MTLNMHKQPTGTSTTQVTDLWHCHGVYVWGFDSETRHSPYRQIVLPLNLMFILVSMLDVQSQVSNFMFSYIDGGAQFRARGALPSQAWEGTPLPLN